MQNPLTSTGEKLIALLRSQAKFIGKYLGNFWYPRFTTGRAGLTIFVDGQALQSDPVAISARLAVAG